ncbi:MAG: prolipoprotein diacylglyceryl transferase, partial [Caulobacteraceae bacterium]
MALPYPNIRPEIFTIPHVRLGPVGLGPFSIRWYALAYIAGILVGWRYAVGLVRNTSLRGARPPAATPTQIDDLIVWITLGVILGGRIGYVLFYMLPLANERALLLSDPLEVLKVWHGGMSFHGGAFGVVVALILFAANRKLDLLRLADIAAACAPFGLFFGRIANFINGELWGRITSVPWAMVFCGPYLQTDASGACIAGYRPRHPSQLYEAALEGVVLFLILRLATHHFGALRRRGVVTGLFLFFYGLFRIALENVRMPDAGLQ